MPSDLLTRVQQLTSGVVEIDGGRLKGSGYGPRDMIQCEVAGRFVPMTHSNFSRRGRLPVKVNVPGEMRPEMTALVEAHQEDARTCARNCGIAL